MYNQATQEIAKPSELLTSVRAYMTVLQSIENYVTIDITRVFNNVLLQQTQHLDSHGEPTITSLYTNWYVSSSPKTLRIHTHIKQEFLQEHYDWNDKRISKEKWMKYIPFHKNTHGILHCYCAGCASIKL